MNRITKKTKAKSAYKPTEQVACKLCKRTFQRKRTPAHYRTKHMAWLQKNISVKKNWDDCVKTPDYNDICDITKIEKVFDIGEASIDRLDGTQAPRGPMAVCRVKLDGTHLIKEETQSFPFEIRHIYDQELFQTWNRGAASRTSKNHTDSTRDKAINFLMYASAYEAYKDLQIEDTCVLCQDPMDPRDDLARFFVTEEAGNVIKPCGENVSHAVHGLCIDDGAVKGMNLLKCPYCNQNGFFL